ncbi:phage head closure protein [Glaciimonas sp. PAMC28666]|uniref:phage head closure protein n=1 Tax=Glaciimonas sp. PAMC28666 TaxID=2807626 RepID=UPI001964AE87|nr:phage head closure protein [Glaciimonas sp. PAMC28666]QRX82248.1 phage head closure protein [Glaciimonas sp. PAMC28666]
MLAGRLTRRITLQSPPTGQDESGNPLTGWTDIATVWASIVDLSGREYIAAAAVQNAVQTKITIRYRQGIVASMRVVHGENIYNVEAILGQGRKALLLMCSRGVSDG